LLHVADEKEKVLPLTDPVPQTVVGYAVSVTPVPVGEVSTRVGAEVQPDPIPTFKPSTEISGSGTP
jgi:hypothetical protein